MKTLVSLLMVLVLHGSAQALEEPTLIVSTVQIEGLERTHEYIVRNEFEFEIGKPTTLQNVEETAQVLRNMGIFARVEYDLEPHEDGTFHLRIELLERWTTLPVFKAARGGGITQLIFAVFDINVLGHFLELGAEYERLGSTNSGVLWFRNPRLFDRRLAFGAEVRASNRVLTLYADDGNVEGGYLLQRNQVWLSLEQEWKWWFRSGLHLQFIDEESSLELISTEVQKLQEARGLPAPQRRLQPGISASIGRLNFDNFKVEGALWILRFDASDTVFGSTSSFASLQSDLFLAKTLPFDSTLAARWIVAASSTTNEPQYYFIGGFDRVRGFPDGRFRGTAHTTANLEFRIPSLDTTWVVLQHVAFLDITAVGANLLKLDGLTAASTGVGIRVISPKIYRFNGRIDFAIPLTSNGEIDLSFGVQQFF